MYTLLPDTDPILHRPTIEFDDWDNAQQLATQLTFCMLFNNGVGLAANQVGLSERYCAVRLNIGTFVMFNPKVISHSKELWTETEGCLSYPGLYLEIPRPLSCVVEYQDETGKVLQKELTEWNCRITLHEIDHLDGKTFVEINA